MLSCSRQRDKPSISSLSADIRFKLSNDPEATTRHQDLLVNRARSIIAELCQNGAIGVLKDIHPILGLRFSPYPFLQKTDRVFSASTLQAAEHDNKLATWGSYDGSGNPIQLNYTAYIKQFVCRRNYFAAPKAGVDLIITPSNTTSNVRRAALARSNITNKKTME